MPLEALAAVGLASNVVQFFSFLCGFFAELAEIRASQSGLTNAHTDLEEVALHLKRLTDRLASCSVPARSPAGQQLKGIADKVTAVSNDLIDAIAKVKTDKRRGRWKTFATAVHGRLGKVQKVRVIAEKLSKLQEQLNTHLLSMMVDQNSEVYQTIQGLVDESKRFSFGSTQTLENAQNDILLNLKSLESKSRLFGTKIEDVLKNIGRLHAINVDDMNELTGRLQRLVESLSTFNDEAEGASMDLTVLRSLHFQTIQMREYHITEAHDKTFEWIFSDDNDSSRFVRWLRHDSDIFWVTGKPGSGKSTLMKFLTDHRMTKKHLGYWASGKTLVIAKYFFWNAGNDLQKSQEGLLRSLLFAILRQCPQQISNTFAARFDELFGIGADLVAWTVPLLFEIFEKLSKQLELSTTFCFFIDGLDEYEGDKRALIKALRILNQSPLVKMCISSRPWSVFRDEYGKTTSQMLKLEDLTRGDIALYVRDILEQHERFDILKQRDRRYEEIVQQIVNKAEGVFLWVFLVVQSLLRGLTSSDRVSDLQRRIELLPPSLEDFFRHILNSVENVYRKETFKAFQYVLHASPCGQIPLMVFSYLDEEDPDFALRQESNYLPQSEIELREEDMRRRLDGRTKGLLEVSPRHPQAVPTVDFLHRTARDFLLTKDMRSIAEKYLDPDFIPDADLMRAYLAQMKLGPESSTSNPLTAVFHYAHELGLRNHPPLFTIIDEVENLVTEEPWYWCPILDLTLDGSFLRHLVMNNLDSYVASRLENCTSIEGKHTTDLLQTALDNVNNSQSGQHYLNPTMIELLLRKGAHPNRLLVSSRGTEWVHFIRSIDALYRNDTTSVLHTLELLISYGADVDAPVLPRHRNIDKSEVVPGLKSGIITAYDIISGIFPNEAKWLRSKAPQSRFAIRRGSIFGWWFSGLRSR